MLDGSLEDWINTGKATGSEFQRSVIRQTLLGVSHLHQCSIAHRDIKSRNLLLCSTTISMTVKIIDFGCAVQLEKGESRFSGSEGTIGYQAP